MPDDRELIEQILAGNHQLYSQIIDRYKGKIVTYLYKMIGNMPDAQDLAQDVFTKTFYLLKDYRPEHKFSSWLYRIASNHCLDEIRRRKRTEQTAIVEEQIVDPETPETTLLKKERDAQLERSIMLLDEEYREVFVLHYLKRLSYREISERLSLTESAVQMRLFRARKEMKKSLTKTMGGGDVYDMLHV
ncbi:RNA polymerase sigma factor [Brevibacillus brevis]|uniref:RNA polymerase sigma factor n=1 Tax=Brevibacillus brevis TaxID=1393 RepID=UPI001C8D4866|nr:RNA polymerase sigma factor [Brevibacillus brevis]MBY0083626.1 RNA polymerase sigma factor [Brevibacillus brevis]